MAIRRGRGVAAINYPTGMNLGGDPSQALVHSTPTGNFMVTLSSVDLGQGLKQVMAQICAETIGVKTEQVIIDTADTDTGPHCMGTFASRGTHRIGNAVIQAAKEARQVMLEVAAEALEVDAGDLDTDGEGNIHVKGAPQKSISIFDTALMAHFKLGRSISGRGMFLVPRSYPEVETGAMKPSTCYAHACTVAEVDVDDETGEVTVVSVKNVFEIGRALNPKMVEQQLVGGSWMGISPRALRDDRALLSEARPRRHRLQRISDAGSRRHRADRDRRAGAPRRRRTVRRQGAGRDVRQPADPGARQRCLRRGRRAHRHDADHARAHPQGAEGTAVRAAA